MQEPTMPNPRQRKRSRFLNESTLIVYFSIRGPPPRLRPTDGTEFHRTMSRVSVQSGSSVSQFAGLCRR